MEIIVNPKTLGKKNVPLPDNFEKLFLRGRLRALLIYIDISHWTLTTYKLQGTTKQTTFSNPLPKQRHHKIIDNNKMNNPYIGIAHIDYVKKDTPPYYGLHETGSGSISYDDFFK